MVSAHFQGFLNLEEPPLLLPLIQKIEVKVWKMEIQVHSTPVFFFSWLLDRELQIYALSAVMVGTEKLKINVYGIDLSLSMWRNCCLLDELQNQGSYQLDRPFLTPNGSLLHCANILIG